MACASNRSALGGAEEIGESARLEEPSTGASFCRLCGEQQDARETCWLAKQNRLMAFLRGLYFCSAPRLETRELADPQGEDAQEEHRREGDFEELCPPNMKVLGLARRLLSVCPGVFSPSVATVRESESPRSSGLAASSEPGAPEQLATSSARPVSPQPLTHQRSEACSREKRRGADETPLRNEETKRRRTGASVTSPQQTASGEPRLSPASENEAESTHGRREPSMECSRHRKDRRDETPALSSLLSLVSQLSSSCICSLPQRLAALVVLEVASESGQTKKHFSASSTVCASLAREEESVKQHLLFALAAYALLHPRLRCLLSVSSRSQQSLWGGSEQIDPQAFHIVCTVELRSRRGSFERRQREGREGEKSGCRGENGATRSQQRELTVVDLVTTQRIVVVGRYRKQSRDLSQTLWVVDNRRKLEMSVEEAIGKPLQWLLDASGFRFISAGREDADVRMLGAGRPFAIELLGCRRPIHFLCRFLRKHARLSSSLRGCPENAAVSGEQKGDGCLLCMRSPHSEKADSTPETQTPGGGRSHGPQGHQPAHSQRESDEPLRRAGDSLERSEGDSKRREAVSEGRSTEAFERRVKEGERSEEKKRHEDGLREGEPLASCPVCRWALCRPRGGAADTLRESRTTCGASLQDSRNDVEEEKEHPQPPSLLPLCPFRCRASRAPGEKRRLVGKTTRKREEETHGVSIPSTTDGSPRSSAERTPCMRWLEEGLLLSSASSLCLEDQLLNARRLCDAEGVERGPALPPCNEEDAPPAVEVYGLRIVTDEPESCIENPTALALPRRHFTTCVATPCLAETASNKDSPQYTNVTSSPSSSSSSSFSSTSCSSSLSSSSSSSSSHSSSASASSSPSASPAASSPASSSSTASTSSSSSCSTHSEPVSSVPVPSGPGEEAPKSSSSPKSEDWRSAGSVEKVVHLALQYGAEEKVKRYECLVFAERPVSPQALREVQETVRSLQGRSAPLAGQQTEERGQDRGQEGEQEREQERDGGLIIYQKTPLRVLHRRSLAVRQRRIYAIDIVPVHPQVFICRLDTQAGTYVKEFVHGDLGRTSPSLSSLLNAPCQLLLLDVCNLVFGAATHNEEDD
ncbi:hypothetical protein TGARI_202740 [Toxoplasma gondii ARI]|uniref:tRNA pseudouridine(55) synthase n=1 Tax=Toxoplasma gondii ARI TaxID=1074872 RepID=A0A139XZE9_TOXGO|nr:hypothetical protein TGARI_202740 [Toxoplasma gondii ARI]